MSKKIYEEVIASRLVKLNQEHAEFQRLHKKFYGKWDDSAKFIHSLLVNTYESILKEIKERMK
jgi:hypothetical protein